MTTKTLMSPFTLPVFNQGNALVARDVTHPRDRFPLVEVKHFADMDYDQVLLLRNWLSDWLGHYKR